MRRATAVREMWIEVVFPQAWTKIPRSGPPEVIRLGWASTEAVPALLSEREELERVLGSSRRIARCVQALAPAAAARPRTVPAVACRPLSAESFYVLVPPPSDLTC